MLLREYQQAAIDRVYALWERVRRVLLVLPTGGGKTVVASAVIGAFVARSSRVLFLAHRRELIKQAFCKLVRSGVHPSEVGIIMAGVPWRCVDAIAPDPASLSDDELWRIWARRRTQALVQVGSIDTFRNHIHPADVGLVIIDEAHRALAKSYCDVQIAYPAAKHLGLTATPIGPNGKPLAPAYDEMVVACTYAELVDLGALVEPICYGLPPDRRVDLRSVAKSGGDYKAEELARVVDKAELVGDIVEHWRRYGNDAPTFVFGVNVAHSKHLAERFLSAGIPAAHVDGGTDTGVRDDALRALRDGRVKVLCNCDVFTEGTDVPEVKTIVLARPTLSIRVYLQQVGRGARPHGDTPFVVLDHAGCCRQPSEGGFGLPQSPRTWDLQGVGKRGYSTGVLPTKYCPQCYAMPPVQARVCRGCGYEFPVDAPSATKAAPEEKPGELVQLNEVEAKRSAATLEREKRALDHWAELCGRWHATNEERAAQGLAPRPSRSVLGLWRRETGKTWPPKGAKFPTLSPEQAEREAARPLVETHGTQVELVATSVPSARRASVEVWDL